MKPDHESDPRWNKVSAALRDAGAADRPADEDLSAPHGFATRVVARVQSDQRAEHTGLATWRRWSLAGAACAILLCGGSLLLKPESQPAEHLLPLPTFEEPSLPSSP